MGLLNSFCGWSKFQLICIRFETNFKLTTIDEKGISRPNLEAHANSRFPGIIVILFPELKVQFMSNFKQSSVFGKKFRSLKRWGWKCKLERMQVQYPQKHKPTMGVISLDLG